jgi:hypothetical protein
MMRFGDNEVDPSEESDTMDRRASKHASDIVRSEFRLRKDVQAIRSGALEMELFDDAPVWHVSNALAAADAAHWRRCLASAQKTGAKADYYRANLNKWHDGFSGRIGNLSEPLF